MTDTDIDVVILELALEVSNRASYLRAGQEWWNLAEDRWGESLNILRGSFADPFYKDERIPKFITSLKDILRNQ